MDWLLDKLDPAILLVIVIVVALFGYGWWVHGVVTEEPTSPRGIQAAATTKARKDCRKLDKAARWITLGAHNTTYAKEGAKAKLIFVTTPEKFTFSGGYAWRKAQLRVDVEVSGLTVPFLYIESTAAIPGVRLSDPFSGSDFVRYTAEELRFSTGEIDNVSFCILP